MARVQFALRMMRARFDPSRSICPYCSSRYHDVIQRKKVLIEARKCQSCGLIYRWPTDRPEENRDFYENAYQKVERLAVPPKESALKELIRLQFKDSIWDKSDRVDFIRRLVGSGGKLLDFGCSWGYGPHQYAEAGFEVTGLELDRKRAGFGQLHLGLDIRSDWENLEDQARFDLVFADHALEHLSDLRGCLDKFEKHSKQDTKLIIFVPNAGCRAAKLLGVKWSPFIGETHMLAFTIDWFSGNLPKHGFYPEFFTSSGKRLKETEYESDDVEIVLVAGRCRRGV